MRVEPWFKLIYWQVQCMQNEIGRFIHGVAGPMPVAEIGRTKTADRITQPVAHRLKLLISSELHLMIHATWLAQGSALCRGTLPMNTRPGPSLHDTPGHYPWKAAACKRRPARSKLSYRHNLRYWLKTAIV